MNPNPCICKVCGHNMGRSRVKGGVVRCNKCKTEFTVTLRPIHTTSEASHEDELSLPSGESTVLKDSSGYLSFCKTIAAKMVAHQERR